MNEQLPIEMYLNNIKYYYTICEEFGHEVERVYVNGVIMEMNLVDDLLI